MVFKHRRGFLIRTRLCLALLVLSVCCAIFITGLSSKYYIIQWNPLESIACYYDTTNDVLPSAEDAAFSPSPDSIFFHETSCRGGLNPRQACAVEAAARAHPNWDVHVLFTGPVKQLKGSLKTLQAFKNIRYARINIEDYASGTPVENLVKRGALNRTRWKVSHASDVLRYLTLYKWGGIYLDLDTVVVKSFDSLKRNWSARESDVAVSAGAMSFSRDQLGRIVAYLAIMNLAANFRGDIWGYNGPGVITRVLKEMCVSTDVSTMSAGTCKGFEVYGPTMFYPISWKQADQYFEPGVLESPRVYVYHVWNRITHDTEIEEDSRYANLAKKYCPTIYKNHGEYFGVGTES